MLTKDLLQEMFAVVNRIKIECLRVKLLTVHCDRTLTINLVNKILNVSREPTICQEKQQKCLQTHYEFFSVGLRKTLPSILAC